MKYNNHKNKNKKFNLKLIQDEIKKSDNYTNLKEKKKINVALIKTREK